MKKGAFIALFVLGLLVLSYTPAHAKVYIDLSAPQSRRLPVAVDEFRLAGEANVPAEGLKALKGELYDTLVSDLAFSGLFDVIDRGANIAWQEAEGAVDFKNWRASGAIVLIRSAFRTGKDSVTIEVRLYDCVEEKEVFARRYTGGAANPRRVVHYFADELYKELTGRPGIFTTRLMFVSDRTGNKEVYISDYDGKNVVQITRNRSINLAPQWSPDGKRILYTSYKKGWPCLYMLDLRTGKDTVVSGKPGFNLGGRFSPDGKSVALSVSGDKSSELYSIDLETMAEKRLTDDYGIDVSPVWSPDGKRLAYVSDRSGNPNIFMLNLADGKQTRLTFGGKYNAGPSWSPDSKMIAYSRSDGGAFNIWVMKPDGGGPTQLTFEGNAKSPSWSPDGRYIVFSSSAKGRNQLYIVRPDGTGLRRIDTGAGNASSPVWSPFID